MTLRLHTGGLCLTSYVTSEGNWVHQILFRGFVANGLNTYTRTTFAFCIFKIFFETSYFFKFHTTNFDCFVYVHSMKSPKNQFKLQVVMQQNRKNAKGVEYFRKALDIRLYYLLCTPILSIHLDYLL